MFAAGMLPRPFTQKRSVLCASSPWLSMNLLSIDENTIIVEETEKPTIRVRPHMK